MIYFNCTSVFHSFIISYIMLKEFPEPEKKACLLIPGHVKNLVDLVPNFMELPFIADVLVVEESCIDLDENVMLKGIAFHDADMIFVGGMERLGMWLMNKGKTYHLRTIIFEEGANIITDIDDHIAYINTFTSIKKGELSRENIHEIWKLNGMLKRPDPQNSIQVHDLEMQKYLHDTEFVKKFLKCMDLLFLQEHKGKLAQIVFFDTYALAANRNCSRFMEKHILQKTIETISEWDYEIKPHPNDFTEWKYEKDYTVNKNTNVPVEVLRLRQSDTDFQETIYIAYGITGCITNELFLLGGTPYVIFLHRILRLYGIEHPAEALSERLYEECNDAQKMKIFFPTTFTELKTILYQITGKDGFKKEDAFSQKEKELSDTGREVRKIYKSMFRNLPDELNETSIMCMGRNNEWEVLASRKILVNQKKYRIEFELPKPCSADEPARDGQGEAQAFRWYIAKGVIVKVKLLSITCLDQENDMVYEVHPEDVEWLDAQKNEDEWYIFNNCDPLAEFQVLPKNRKPFQKIVIESEMEWDLSYEAMLLLRNKNLADMARSLERLANDNMVRETTIQQLNAHLQDWEREVHNRDEEIKITIQQRDEWNAILVKEREQWLAAMSEKDKRIEELEIECRGRIKGGLHLGRKRNRRKKF